MSRYPQWPCIFEALAYLRTLADVVTPLQDIRRYVDCDFGGERMRVYNEPNSAPMLQVNRLVKAIWDVVRTFRIFIRTARLFLASDEGQSEPNDFWVYWPPVLQPSVQSLLARVIWGEFNIRCFQIDADWNCPPQFPPDGDEVGFLANLLGPGVRAERYETSRALLMEIYMFLLGDGEIVHEMLDCWELINPPMVSYGLPVAVKYYNMWRDVDSPEIRPDRGNDVGNLGHEAT